MTTAEVLELINDFSAKDDSRSTISRPWLDKGLIKACEGHTLITLPEALCPGHQVHPNELAPDIDKLNLFAEHRSFILFDTDVLKPILASKADEAEAVEQDCPACWGRKTRCCPTCDEGEIDCDECDGTGKVFVNRLGKYIHQGFHPVPFLGRFLNYKYLKLLDRAVDLFGGSWKISLGQVVEGMAYSHDPALFMNDAGVAVAILEMRP